MGKSAVSRQTLALPIAGIAVHADHEPSLAQQLADQLRWRIAVQQLLPGDVLPPARRLAVHLGIHLHTVRAAYHQLAEDGLVEVRRGIGTRVLPHSAAALAQPGGSATRTIAVILPSITNPFYHLLVEGIEAEALRDGTLVFLCLTHDEPQQAHRHARRVIAGRVDGIVAVAHDLTPEIGIPAPIPVISLDCPDAPPPSVNLDLEAVGRLATRHLIEHGHRGIACVVPSTPNAHALQVGYQNTLAESGIPPDAALVIVTADFQPGSGRQALRQLLDTSPPPSAAFIGADLLAIGLLQAAAEEGCRIPDDLAIVSFNDIPAAAFLNPPLSTVAAPARQMGEDAMRLLRALLRGERCEPSEVRLACELVIRRSCGCPDAKLLI